MKLLQKKDDIDRAKAAERKMEIDDGMGLARQVDDLRRIKAEEEKNILEYRNGMMKVIRSEIDSLVEDRDNLLRWNTEARAERERLLEPLDDEWEKISLEKESLRKEREDAFISRETLKSDAIRDRESKKAILALIARSKRTESEAKRIFNESVAFSENAVTEREKAISERKSQSDDHSRRMADADLLVGTYQNGINVNAMEEKRLGEREKELIIRENDLARRTKNLQVSQEYLKKS